MNLVYILIAVLFFGILVAIHEGGHFMAAKACGVKVNEFSIGMGPAIFKKQKGETLYSLRCIPVGGYCAMAGEDEASEDPRAFTNIVAWKKLIVLVAGSFMNFLLGFLMAALLCSDAVGFRSPVLAGFMEGCPYEGENALHAGDRILKIDGHRVYMYYDVSDFLAQGDGVYDIVVRRDGRRVKLNDFKMVPIEYEGQPNKLYGFYFGVDEATFGAKMRHSWNNSMEFARMVWMSLGQLFSGEATVNDLSGPVGIVDLMAETGEQSESAADAAFNLTYLGAFIAINLAVMNMLPIPALDGGRVFLLFVTWIIEKIIRRRLDPKYEGYIHAAGMIILLSLMAYVMFHDIFRIVTG